jgi:hypothetical protein
VYSTGFFSSLGGSSVVWLGSSDPWWVLPFLEWIVVFVAGPFSADLGHLQKNARFWVAF